MQKVVIIGCGGSGKSTLARKLGTHTGLPVVHLDQIWWQPGSWEHLSREEFDVQLDAVLNSERWILDGNFNRTLERRLDFCDTVIYLDYNRFVCIWSWLKRMVRYWGKSRPDMGPDCPEKFDWSFFTWLWNFNKTNRKNYHALLKARTNLKVYIFRNRRQLRKYWNNLTTG